MNRIASTLPVVLIVMCLCGVFARPARAQPRVYQSNLADEDWSFLKDASKRQDWWDPAKYIPFPREDWFVTLSGEIRYRPEGFRIKATDIAPATRDQYLLQRYLFGADFHLGKQLRVYTELQSGLISGRIGGSRPTDQNKIDLHQGFVEWKSSGDEAPGFGVRVGRQELTIGNSRLISAAPGLNVKRSFDGARVAMATGSWRFDGAAAELTSLESGAFDDVPDHQIRFWGASARRAGAGWKRAWTVYYLGLENEDLQLAQGRGKDVRHTIGLNFRAVHGMLDFNYDGIVQAGTFQGNEVRA